MISHTASARIPGRSVAGRSPSPLLLAALVLLLLALTPAQAPGQSDGAGATEDFLEDDFGSGETPAVETARVPDPLYYWNKGMYHFNDKLYFWVLKPVSKGYRTVVPTLVRTGIKNFFYNLGTPVRTLNCFLQSKSEQGGAEIARFMVNTTVGGLGFWDYASRDPRLNSADEDLGQTLGVWGVGEGIYIVWPVFGPSTLRDSIGDFGDRFLDPITYVEPVEAAYGANALDTVNSTSFRIGDYEALKEAALDPYEAIRDAYLQNRAKKIEE